MKNRHTKAGPLLLLLSVASFAPAAFAQTQLSDVPPVSMGLWQTETSSTVTGLENTPMAAMAGAIGRPHVTQSCLTPETWKRDIEGLRNRERCTLSNVHQDSHEVSFDEVCATGRSGNNSSHVDILIDSTEHAHGTIVMKVTEPSLPQPMTVNVTMLSHYMSAACGDVKPGEGRLIK